MPSAKTGNTALHEWRIQVILGSISATVFAATEAEAETLATPELEAKLADALYDGSWYFDDEGAVDMDDAAEAGAAQTAAKGDDAPRQT